MYSQELINEINKLPVYKGHIIPNNKEISAKFIEKEKVISTILKYFAENNFNNNKRSFSFVIGD